MTTSLEGGERSASRSGRSLPPGKTRYSLGCTVGPHSLTVLLNFVQVNGLRLRVLQTGVRFLPFDEKISVCSSLTKHEAY
jgi:hypothetical protein